MTAYRVEVRSGEPVTPEPRRMTPARRARILSAFDGRCAYPECSETAGLEIDHTIALELGGKDADHNLRPLCERHHKQKTALDARLIAKMRRRKAKNDGTYPKPLRPLHSRGFGPSRRGA
jgi:5-methylcytosine-specific restriction endonuclease McrA